MLYQFFSSSINFYSSALNNSLNRSPISLKSSRATLKDWSVEERDSKSAKEVFERLAVSSRECTEKIGIFLSEGNEEEVVPFDPDCS